VCPLVQAGELILPDFVVFAEKPGDGPLGGLRNTTHADEQFLTFNVFNGNTVQASDDELEGMLGQTMTSAGLTIDVRNPRGTIPGGEAEVVHRGGGRYVSAIGRNAMFHNPDDRGPQVVDARTIAAFVDAFAIVAKALAGPELHR